MEKNRVITLTHSLTHPACLMPQELKLLLQNIFAIFGQSVPHNLESVDAHISYNWLTAQGDIIFTIYKSDTLVRN